MDVPLVFLLGLSCLGSSFAETPEELRRQLQSAVKSCGTNEVDSKILETIKSSENIRDREILTPEATCLLECLLKKAGVVTNGKIDVPRVSRLIQVLGNDQNNVKTAVEAFEKCDTHQISTKSQCPVGELIKDCEHEFANDMTMLGFILRGA